MQKHVVLFISALRKGGAERVALNLAVSLRERGYRVTLVTQYRCEDEYALPEGIPRILSEITKEEQAGNRLGDFLARYRKLRRIWKELSPDCILSFIGKNNLMAIQAAAGTGIPVVVSVRGEPSKEYYSRGMRLSAALLFPHAAGVVLQTRAAGEFFSRRVRKRSVILKNPLNPAFDRPRYQGKRDGRIVSVGRLDQNKNHALLLRAYARIAADFPQTRIEIFGEGEQREALIALAKELGLSDRLSLPGIVSDIPDRIYEASVFTLTSWHEGMPNALLEAMCLGVPSIATDCPCGGPAELIREGENGYLIPPGDEAALADRLRSLLMDEEAAGRMGARAAELLEAYRPERVNQEWEEYLRSRMRA